MNTVFSNFPFTRYCICLIIGILVNLYFEIDIVYVAIGLGVTVVSYFALFFINAGRFRSLLGTIGILFLVLFGYLNAYWALPIRQKTHIIHQKNFDFYQAKIISLVEEKPKSWKAIAETNQIWSGSKKQITDGKILLYFDKKVVQKPQYNQILLIKGHPSEIDGPKNPGEFDYKRYLKYQGIFHQHYLRDTSFAIVSTKAPRSFLGFAYKITSYCDSVFTHYIAEKTNLAVVNAMVLGLRDDIDNDLIQAYSAAGAIHVLSVSGLHVGVIYIILVGILGFMKKWGRLGKWSFVGVILGILWLYAAVTGFSSPVLRSTFMFSMILIGENMNKQDNSYNTVSFSAFVLLIINPFFITNVGFLLSFLAVLGMIQIQPLLNPLIVIDKNKNWLNWLLDRLWKVSTVAIAAQIATLPITIYFFHQFPNYFLLANPLVILLSSVVLIGGLAFLIFQLFFQILNLSIINIWLAYILEWLVNALNKTVIFTENLPGSISKYLDFSTTEVVILYAIIFSVLAIWQTKSYFWVKMATFLTCILIGLSIQSYWDTKNQSLVCIHAIPKTTAFSIINGNSVLLVADSSFLQDRKNISYRLNNFWSNKGIINVQKQALAGTSQIFIWKGKSYLLLNEKFFPTANLTHQTIDYLIIKNKKIGYFADIKNKISFKNLIIDGSISQFYTTRLEVEAAQDGVLAYSSLKNGAIIL